MKPPCAPSPPCEILVVKLSSLGDVVRSTGCLQRLREAWPEARIRFVVDERFAPVLEGHLGLDDLIVAPSIHRGLGVQLLHAARQLRSLGSPRFDLAIDLQGNRFSTAWMYAARARVRLGRGGFRPGWAATRAGSLLLNDVEDQARILGLLGLPEQPLPPRLPILPEADRRVGEVLAGMGLSSKEFVVLNPFSAWSSKEWPWDRYAAVAQRLLTERGIPSVVTSGPGEAARMPSPDGTGWHSVAGQLSLPELAALLHRARLVLTGDSGPMHMAAAAGTPVVALFGPTWPQRSGPWGTGHRVLQASRPDHHHAYRDPDSRRHILALDVPTVATSVLDALEPRGNP